MTGPNGETLTKVAEWHNDGSHHGRFVVVNGWKDAPDLTAYQRAKRLEMAIEMMVAGGLIEEAKVADLLRYIDDYHTAEIKQATEPRK